MSVLKKKQEDEYHIVHQEAQIEDNMTRYAITRGMIDLYKDLYNITDELQ